MIANPTSAAFTFEVEVHHRDIDIGEDKYTAVKVVRTGTVLPPIEQGPRFTGKGKKTLEIASFDNVFAPYIKPPA